MATADLAMYSSLGVFLQLIPSAYVQPGCKVYTDEDTFTSTLPRTTCRLANTLLAFVARWCGRWLKHELLHNQHIAVSARQHHATQDCSALD